MWFKKKAIVAALVLCFVIVLTGCGKGNAGSSSDPNKGDGSAQKIEITQPVTVKVAVAPNYIPEDQFQQFIVEPVKAKYPNITVELLPFAPNLKSLQNMIAQGELPDLLVTSSNIMDPMQTVGFATNIEPYLKKAQIDLSKFEEGSLKAVKTASGGQYLSALPYSRNFSVLYYNKDIFDKFGVAYPKDGMTWNDAIELAKKVTRSDGGTQYLGLHPDYIYRSASQLGLGFVDPQTMKAIVNNDKWKEVFETQKSIFSIPGNTFTPGSNATKLFTKDKTLAMYATINLFGNLAEITDLNWDMASYPTFPEAQGKGINYDLHVIALTANSEHKDAAALVMSVLASDEVQTSIAKTGRISVMKDEKFRKPFGQDLSYLQGKNVGAIFKVTPADNYPPTEFDTESRGIVNDISADVFTKDLDINTALRQAEEKINQAVEENKAQ